MSNIKAGDKVRIMTMEEMTEFHEKGGETYGMHEDMPNAQYGETREVTRTYSTGAINVKHEKYDYDYHYRTVILVEDKQE